MSASLNRRIAKPVFWQNQIFPGRDIGSVQRMGELVAVAQWAGPVFAQESQLKHPRCDKAAQIYQTSSVIGMVMNHPKMTANFFEERACHLKKSWIPPTLNAMNLDHLVFAAMPPLVSSVTDHLMKKLQRLRNGSNSTPADVRDGRPLTSRRDLSFPVEMPTPPSVSILRHAVFGCPNRGN